MLTVAPILLLAVAVVVLLRRSGLRPLHAVTCALFGFYLSTTSMASGITSSLAKLTGAIGGIHI